MAKHITERAKRKIRIEQLQKRMQELLGIDEQEYSEYMYVYGVRYIKAYLPHDMNAWDKTQRSAEYWRSWRNNWMIREEEFVKRAEQLPMWKLILEWEQLHNPDELVKQKNSFGLIQCNRSIDEVCRNKEKQHSV